MTVPEPELDAARQALHHLVRRYRIDHLCVAYSGGADSTALLHLAVDWARCAGLGVSAHHVDHGLHADSARWAEFCSARASELEVPLRVTRLAERPPRGASIEAWARQARYAALARHCAAGDAVLTAHHREDQIETVLQRVVHAAGPHGLAGIRPARPLGRGLLARPLLECARSELLDYLDRRQLRWLDDPANADRRFLRNRLRHEALPALEAAVPGAASGLLRLAELQGALARGLDACADGLMAAAPSRCLPLELLDDVPAELAPYLLRRFLARAGCLPVGGTQLRAILATMRGARADACPEVRWAGHAVRRYRGCLHVTADPLPPVPAAPVPWHPDSALVLACGRLSAARGEPGDVDAARLERAGAINVAFRRGGERCRPVGRGHHHVLKKLFQEWGVPPWERDRVPLLYVDGELAAVVGHCVCVGYAARPGQARYRLEWVPA